MLMCVMLELDANNPGKGVQVVFNNGDICASSGKPRQTTLIFFCDPVCVCSDLSSFVLQLPCCGTTILPALKKLDDDCCLRVDRFQACGGGATRRSALWLGFLYQYHVFMHGVAHRPCCAYVPSV